LVGVFTIVISIGFITAVFLALVGVFAVWGFVWATDSTFWDALSVALFLVPSAAETIAGHALFSGFTAYFVVLTAAVFNASVVLSGAVVGWGVTAWFVLWPALSVAYDFVVVTAEIVGAWLTVVA